MTDKRDELIEKLVGALIRIASPIVLYKDIGITDAEIAQQALAEAKQLGYME